ncbi:hypothetical protein EXE53_16750 [Halorubrum sp. SD626R]|nr:hypothetical protein EXE53_16750 [Halorubrum sp. SD626R]
MCVSCIYSDAADSMKVTFIHPRFDVLSMPLTKPILDLVSSYPSATVVEIGVAQAEGAVQFLKMDTVDKYIGIDPWEHYDEAPDEEFDDGYLDRKMGTWASQDDFNDAEKHAKERLKPFGGRYRLLRDYSHNVTGDVTEQIDVLHIDGNHQYEYVYRDLKLYYPKVKPGGLIIADDYTFTGSDIVGGYGGPKAYEVDKAVDEFCGNRDLEINTIDGSAIIIKPDEDNVENYHQRMNQVRRLSESSFNQFVKKSTKKVIDSLFR